MVDYGRPASIEAWSLALARLNLDPDLQASPLELAWLPKGWDPELRRQVALMALLLLVARSQGSTMLPLEGPELESLKELFQAPELDPRALLKDPRLEPLVGRPGVIRPFVVEGDGISTGRLRAAEETLAARIREMTELEIDAIDVSPDILEAPVVLSGEQREAVRAAVSRPLALITGGPGTGKTSIVLAILRAAMQSGLDPADIALAAPTGRAATRMGEAIRKGLGGALLQPRTLHRLLGWHATSGHFRFNARNPLLAQLVIVDEASMVGLELMAALMEALRSGARLVLLGDAEQLPSVEAGSVFRDLVEALPGSTVRLTYSFRMDPADPGGRAILLAAQAFRKGENLLPERGGLDEIQGLGAEFLEAGNLEMGAFLEAWGEEQLWTSTVQRECLRPFQLQEGCWAPEEEERLRALFTHFSRSRILCPLRASAGLQGVEAVNAFLHERWQKLVGRGLAKDLMLLAGEPVVVKRNDYGRGLFNGDWGLVLIVARPGAEAHQSVVFPKGEGFEAFPLGPLLPDLELGYANTVHRAQGSEFDRVALILPREDTPLMTREILYTALTRARKSAVVLGSREILEKALARRIQRQTLLHTMLA